jgi:hypothetical protein
MRTPRGLVTIAVGMLAVLAAGCGGSSSSTPGASASAALSGGPLAALTARQIMTKAIADFKASSSVHVAGSERDSGQTFTMDMTVGASGCTGTVGLGGQGSVRLLRIGGTIWIKPDDKYWKSALQATPGDLPAVEGKYVRLSPNGPATSSFSSFCYLSQLASQLSAGEDRVTKGQTATVLGQSALQLKDTQQAGAAYVTISATPEILQTGGGSGQVDFTYGAPLTLTRPPARQTIAGAKYGL